MPMSPSTKWVVALVAVAAVGLMGCEKVGCLNDDPGCKVVSPCHVVQMSCPTPGALDVHSVTSGTDRAKSPNALAAKGDAFLSNGIVQAVIAGMGNQNYLDPNGGSLLDLSNDGK